MKCLVINCDLIREISDDEKSQDAEEYVLNQLLEFGIGIQMRNMYVTESTED